MILISIKISYKDQSLRLNINTGDFALSRRRSSIEMCVEAGQHYHHTFW